MRDLSMKLRADCDGAHKCHGQDPSNSSRPPSSRALWEQGQIEDTTGERAPEEREQADEEPRRSAPGTSPEPACTQENSTGPVGQRPSALSEVRPGCSALHEEQHDHLMSIRPAVRRFLQP